MSLTLKPDLQHGDGPFVGMGIGPHARVFQHEVLGWPIPGQTIVLRDMRATGHPSRWQISRNNCKTWEGDFESAEAGLTALQAKLS